MSDTIHPAAPPSWPLGLFVTGTDTGVGKTRTGAALAWALQQRGLRVRVRKPAESGCPTGPDGYEPQDAQTLRQAAGAIEPLEQVCRYRLRAPLSPARAARLEQVELTLDGLRGACLQGLEAGDFLFVEGAGGFYSPIAEAALNADLAQALGLPVLVVAADRLGTINHCLMTVEALRRRGLTLAGLVLNQPAVTDNADGMDNAADLAEWLRCPVLRLPHAQDHGPSAWAREAAALAALVDRWSPR